MEEQKTLLLHLYVKINKLKKKKKKAAENHWTVVLERKDLYGTQQTAKLQISFKGGE